jgi:hypothetical protein
MIFSSELIRDEEMMQMKRVLRKRLFLFMRRKEEEATQGYHKSKGFQQLQQHQGKVHQLRDIKDLSYKTYL